MMRARWLVLACVWAVAACGDRGLVAGPEGALRLDVAPLSLDGVIDATWRVTVTNARGETVWQRALTSSAFGDGAGGLSYVGTCDAAADANPNVVALELLDLTDGGGLVDPATYVNPTASAPLTRQVTCVADGDVSVVFDVTVARQAQQGFFDVAVELDDIYCSAKLDCLDDQGQPLMLLHDGAGGRGQTAVMALACTAGPGAATRLYMNATAITCQGAGGPQTFALNPAGAPGNQGPLPPALFEHQIHRGVEQLGNYHKAYWNVALGLDLDGLVAAGLHSCALTAQATASDTPFVDGLSPDGAGWPRVQWDVNLTDAAGALACGRHEVGGGDGVAVAYGAAAPEPWCYEYDPDFLGAPPSPAVVDYCAGPVASFVYCRATRNEPASAGTNALTFTAAECGGALPPAGYVGMLSRAATNAYGIEDVVVIDPAEGAPGVTYWMRGASATALDFAVLYVDPASVPAGDVVKCRYDHSLPIPGSVEYTHTWTAAQCTGGVTPDATYRYALSQARQCGSDEDWGATATGIRFWISSDACAGSNWGATYFPAGSAVLDGAILCQHTLAVPATVGENVHTWDVATECGGQTPTADHVGVLVHGISWGPDGDWRVLNANDPAGPGIAYTMAATPGGLGGGFAVLYLKVQ